MKRIMTIATKEVLFYFTNPVGYIFAGLLMIVSYWIFFQDFFVLNQATLGGLWGNMTFLLSLFIPALSMNSLAEEKKQGTWEVMLSLPVSETELVLGKFIGSWLFVMMTLLLALPAVITVLLLGKPDVGILAGGWVGLLLAASLQLAVGVFASSLSQQPIVGFLVAAVVLLLNNFIGQDMVLSRLPTVIAAIAGYASISWHSGQFGNGLFKLSDVMFFVSMSIIFLTLTVLSLKSRHK